MKKRGLVVGNDGNIEPGPSIDIMHQLGIPHLHSCLLLTRTNYRNKALEVLLQKRASTKSQYPGHFCFSAAGHCNYMDYVRTRKTADIHGISREAEEELGIKLANIESATERPYIIDSSGKEIDLLDMSIHRLQDLPPSNKNKVNPYIEKPILTVAQLHLLDRDIKLLSGMEVESTKWVPLDQVNQLAITPWLEYFLNATYFVKTDKTWGQYHNQQGEFAPHASKSPVATVCSNH
jgi:isopentenyldiphosphate isomerase